MIVSGGERLFNDGNSYSTMKTSQGKLMVLADKYESEEDEELLSGKKAKQEKENTELRQENAELRQKLRRTEMKFLRLADAMESVHSVINPLQRRLLAAQRLLRTAATLSSHLDTEATEVKNAKDALASIRAFPKEHATAMDKMLGPANEACEFFGERYPSLAARIFLHSENDSPTPNLNDWIDNWQPNNGRLFDDDDVRDETSSDREGKEYIAL